MLRITVGEMKVRLIRKLAECIDGVDLSDCEVGDVLSLPRREAWLLLAEGWADEAYGQNRDSFRRRQSAEESASA